MRRVMASPTADLAKLGQLGHLGSNPRHQPMRPRFSRGSERGPDEDCGEHGEESRHRAPDMFDCCAKRLEFQSASPADVAESPASGQPLALHV